MPFVIERLTFPCCDEGQHVVRNEAGVDEFDVLEPDKLSAELLRNNIYMLITGNSARKFSPIC